jgi:hypothetical protein
VNSNVSNGYFSSPAINWQNETASTVTRSNGNGNGNQFNNDVVVSERTASEQCLPNGRTHQRQNEERS